jgi:hypothetical protein
MLFSFCACPVGSENRTGVKCGAYFSGARLAVIQWSFNGNSIEIQWKFSRNSIAIEY